MPRHLRISSAAAFLSVSMSAVPGAAQPAELRSRVDEFVTALREMEPMEKIASFFPRRGVWEFVETPDKVAPGARVSRRRFGPEHTLTAIREGGPLCGSFGGVRGDVGAHEGVLVGQVQMNKGRWVHAGGNRFVPPGKGARSPIFLEWTREDGRWVIARVGEEFWYSPRVRRDPDWPVVRRNLVAGAGCPSSAHSPRPPSGTPITSRSGSTGGFSTSMGLCGRSVRTRWRGSARSGSCPSSSTGAAWARRRWSTLSPGSGSTSRTRT